MLEEKTKQLKSNVSPLCTLSATPKTQALIKRFEGSRFFLLILLILNGLDRKELRTTNNALGRQLLSIVSSEKNFHF